MDGQPEITQLLVDWSKGDSLALEKLAPLVYQELRALARSQMRKERSDHTLQATALVHEVYLKLIDQRKVTWQSRSQFFGVAAKMMRRILVDHAKSVKASKRGGDVLKTLLRDQSLSINEDKDLVALDDALKALERIDSRKVQVVEFKFFGGMTTEETAAALKISVATVERDWNMAKAWLHREMVGPSGAPPQI